MDKTSQSRKQLKFMQKACLLCDNSLCGYKTGCIAVKNGEILVEGWNETLPGEIYCQNGTCIREEEGLKNGASPEKVCCIHAEASVVSQAASKGISLEGADIYVTTFPCLICSRMLAKLKPARVFYMSDYMGENLGVSLLNASNIEVIQLLEKDVWAESSTERLGD